MVKVAFFQKKNIPKKYPENISRQKQYHVMGENFKFQVQDSFFGIIFFGRFEKRIALSERKPPLVVASTS